MAAIDIQKLKEAIFKFLVTDTNSFKTAIGAEFFDTINTRLAKDVVYPYCVYQFLPGQIDRDNATKYEKPVIRFSLFDDSGSAKDLTNLASLLDARFDECENSLGTSGTVTGMKILDVRRITSMSNIINTGFGTWQLVLDYEIHLQRT